MVKEVYICGIVILWLSVISGKSKFSPFTSAYVKVYNLERENYSKNITVLA